MILLFGYWPPTDIGIDTRHGMLWQWRALQENYKGSGYDVLAITPTFQTQLGWFDVAMTNPYWGKGSGQLMVDYRDTSEDFWAIVKKYVPVAIMSFSRGKPDKSWELEEVEQNRPQTAWTTALTYIDNNGVPQTETWDPPFPGGSDEDFSPFRGLGAIFGNPPDRSQAANKTRSSNLPMTAIKAAIEAQFPNPPGSIVPEIDDGTSGAFVSGYMGYHVSWYRDYIHGLGDPARRCEFAGHTHVGVDVAVADAAKAVEIQLDELIEVLP